MEFTGRLYFDFTSREVFRLYRMLVAAQDQGATLRLEWRAFSAGDEALDREVLAAAELIAREYPERHGAFVQAVLAAVHLEATNPGDPGLIRLAARVAGLPAGSPSAGSVGDEGARTLQTTEAEARNLGVTTVPTFYRHGPVMQVRTTPLVDQGDSLARLRLIDAVLEDDGLWGLSKP